jgi:hypothetical protein
MIKIPTTAVMIIGHDHPEYIIDTAESIKYYNKGNYEIVFAIDFNRKVAATIEEKYGKDHVFVTKEINGWGRGILRTIIHALDYFNERMNICNLITMDSDALCVGPFVNTMLKKTEETDVFWVGTTWYTPSKDYGYHRSLRASGFMSEFPYTFKTQMCAGPCMMWTNHCFKFMKQVGLIPGNEFDKKYSLIHFAHDQISTYFIGCGIGRIENVSQLMEIRWRQALPTTNLAPWGNIPITYENTAIIHPTKSNVYKEENCRNYFRGKRKVSILL